MTLAHWMPCTVKTPALATLFPNRKSLRLTCTFSSDLESLLRHAPTSLTQLTFGILFSPRLTLQDNCLARLECLERLCLHGVDAAVLLPSIRRSRINHLHISVKLGFTDEIMLKLVDGPTCMENLKELQLDHVSYRQGPQSWTRHELVLALRRDKQYDLAQVKATLSPKSPQSCSPDGLREVMDAAHKNGIKVFGTAVDCLD